MSKAFQSCLVIAILLLWGTGCSSQPRGIWPERIAQDVRLDPGQVSRLHEIAVKARSRRLITVVLDVHSSTLTVADHWIENGQLRCELTTITPFNDSEPALVLYASDDAQLIAMYAGLQREGATVLAYRESSQFGGIAWAITDRGRHVRIDDVLPPEHLLLLLSHSRDLLHNQERMDPSSLRLAQSGLRDLLSEVKFDSSHRWFMAVRIFDFAMAGFTPRDHE